MLTAILLIGLVITGILIQKTAEYLDRTFILNRQEDLIPNDNPEQSFEALLKRNDPGQD